MATQTNGIMGIGYEGQDLTSFLESLKVWGTSTLVDVRLNPISRKKGFSKRALSEALASAGIEYLHMPKLGNPKDNREGFAEPRSDAGKAARRRFQEILETDDALYAVDQLADLASRQVVVLLCFEASELCCHRSLVLCAVKAKALVAA